MKEAKAIAKDEVLSSRRLNLEHPDVNASREQIGASKANSSFCLSPSKPKHSS
jgi:hypothetical protein